jgi:pyruvate/2-oxoglutarate dehydrogenase complex dihydrolipoamide acyltransferase (E2) component
VITKVILPKSGMGIDEGVVTRWLKAVGETVKQGEPLAEIETAKATMEVEAPANGTLVKILVGEGQSAPVNTEIAEIDGSGG